MALAQRFRGSRHGGDRDTTGRTIGPLRISHEQAARLLGYPVQTVIELGEQGVLERITVDGLTQLSWASVAMLLDETGSRPPQEVVDEIQARRDAAAAAHPEGREAWWRAECYPDGISDEAWAKRWGVDGIADAEEIRQQQRARPVEADPRILYQAILDDENDPLL